MANGEDVMRHFMGAGALALLLAGCGTPSDVNGGALGSAGGGNGPQYEPGDPCKGVVPQMCAY
ncbi:hypothetical protein SAMN04488011_10428 [Palleronia pelagia]|uniref:Lipoprotein n=2 Tax=Palleronia pelagia TaxID=387096 RepID=A0A1H8GD50_9RHOB|nr:hypothetical protein SAMN04488011_10428 [Palleronia pelagia]